LCNPPLRQAAGTLYEQTSFALAEIAAEQSAENSARWEAAGNWAVANGIQF
jgi:hypothetical protein